MRCRSFSCTVLVMSWLVAMPVLATPAEDSEPKPHRKAEVSRPVPNYAPAAEDSTSEVLLWGPRILFFPVYAVSEYVIRRPLHSFMRYAEKNYWPENLKEYFTFGPERQAGFIPAFVVDLGLRPRGGGLLYWNRALSKRNRMRLRLSANESSWKVTFDDRYSFGGSQFLNFRLNRSDVSDFTVWSPGPESGSSSVQYGASTLESGFLFESQSWRSSRWSLGFSVVDRHFEKPEPASPSLQSSVVPSVEDYTAARIELSVALDSRRKRHPEGAPQIADFVSPSGSGVRLSVRSALVEALRTQHSSPANAWLDYGGTAAAYFDVTGTQRTLGVSVTARVIHPWVGGEVPFAEQVALGGVYPMPGFRERRLAGLSSLAARLDYRWPVWATLDGIAGASVGNAFGRYFSGLAVKRMRTSFDWGIRSTQSRDQSFSVLVGVGTQTLQHGLDFKEVRFTTTSSSRF